MTLSNSLNAWPAMPSHHRPSDREARSGVPLAQCLQRPGMRFSSDFRGCPLLATRPLPLGTSQGLLGRGQDETGEQEVGLNHRQTDEPGTRGRGYMETGERNEAKGSATAANHSRVGHELTVHARGRRVASGIMHSAAERLECTEMDRLVVIFKVPLVTIGT